MLVEDVQYRREARERRPEPEVQQKPVEQVDEENREDEIEASKRARGRSRQEPHEVRSEKPEGEGPRDVGGEVRRGRGHLEVHEGVPILERLVRVIDPPVEKQHGGGDEDEDEQVLPAGAIRCGVVRHAPHFRFNRLLKQAHSASGSRSGSGDDPQSGLVPACVTCYTDRTIVRRDKRYRRRITQGVVP
jgi:hypothetical protein